MWTLILAPWLTAWPSPQPFPFTARPLVTVHVATNGNDTTGNGSLVLPYRTISKAALAAMPGTEILLLPGTHAGGAFLYDLHGTTNLPIWIRGASPTNRPVVFGASEGLHLTRARYVVLQNLEVAGASANGINCDDGGSYADTNASGFLVFSNVVVRDIGSGGNQDGIKLSGIYDFYMYDIEAARCGGSASGSGIDMVGCHRGLIQGGSFYDLSANAIQAKGGTSDIEIRQCIISNAGHRGVNIGGSTDFEFFRPPLSTNTANVEASNIRVYANVFIGCTSTVAFASATNCVVANNTIVEPTRWVFRILQETTSLGGYTFAPCGNNIFRNNIVYYNHAVLNRYVNEGGSTDPGSFLVQNNMWYAYDNPGAAPHSLPGTVSGNRYGLNPAFSNAAVQNYRITLHSPAATSGVVAASMSTDRAGVSFLTPPSLGAYEIDGDIEEDGLPDYWEMSFFTSLVFHASSDPDGDGSSNHDEWVADTHPASAASRIAMLSIHTSETGSLLRWQGGRRTVQYVETSTPGSGDWVAVVTNLPPTPITNEWTWSTAELSSWIRLRVSSAPASPH